jgi:hypothetical protein
MEILIGNVFSKLTVVSFSRYKPRKGNFWICKCECGSIKEVMASNLINKGTKSCGCLKSDKNKGYLTKTSEYRSWYNMKTRCLNKKTNAYINYGGRGINVCERWLDFNNFLLDMGKKPSSDYSIERIDNNGNYEPSNCRWATTQEQNLNQRSNLNLLVNGVKYPLKEFCELTGIKIHTYYRFKNELTAQEIFNKFKKQSL